MGCEGRGPDQVCPLGGIWESPPHFWRATEHQNRILQWIDSVQLYLLLTSSPVDSQENTAILLWVLPNGNESLGVGPRQEGGGQDKKGWGRGRNQLPEAFQWLWGKVGSQSQNPSTSGLGRALDIILANLYMLGHEPKIQGEEGT